MPDAEKQPIHSFRDLLVWQKGMDLAVMIYDISEKLPSRERFGLIRQMQRAAVSVPTNISEGHARKRTGHFLHHLSIAAGSLAEVDSLLEMCVRLQYVHPIEVKVAFERIQELGRMIEGLIQKLESKRP
jgi:four helix bundle protein